MSDRVFVDTNVFLYLNDIEGTEKKNIVLSILDNRPVISPQIIFECINVCKRKLKMTNKEWLVFAQELIKVCEVTEENQDVVNKALEICAKHSFQPFDAKIVATALVSGCSTLYSEDMQHGFVIDNKLTIVNPFV